MLLFVAVPAVLALGGGLLVLGRSQPASSAATPAIKPLHALKHHRAAKLARKAIAIPARKPKAQPAHHARKKAPTVIDGMPAAMAKALATHDVAVVALFQPGGRVDDIAVKEAQAGAQLAGAGFATVNVLNDAQAGPLATLIASASSASDRLLDAPAVLIFQRPKALFVRLNGFADRETVAQAAANAVSASAPASPRVTSWVEGANAACRGLRQQLRALPLPTTSQGVIDFATQMAAAVQATVDQLRVLVPPAGQRAKVAEMLADYDAAVTKLKRVLAAAKRGDRATVDKLKGQVSDAGKRGDAIAAELGASACASGVTA